MSILANNINEEIKEILEEHNNNIDRKIEEQNKKRACPYEQAPFQKF